MNQEQALKCALNRRSTDLYSSLHQKVDLEVTALHAKADQLEGFVKQLAAHAHITLEY